MRYRRVLVRWLLSFSLAVAVGMTGPCSIVAQVRPIYDRGTVGLMQLLKRLNTTASVLMIGAHPDDEDTALLAYLARGESARTAYLSLTRGDGGQNIIGPELGEALGVIRTEELLQARRLDGAEQYFTRAYDYGFSKTLAEAKENWDEKIILCDVVKVIRDFRPLVVISQFTGTSADGHGQHQFAGYISPVAVRAAADPRQCTNAGIIWQVKKFYVRHGFRASGEAKLKINTGKYDPLLGRSYFEIAMEARSQHKSQEQGVLELRGDQFSGLNVNVGNASAAPELSIFDELDTSIAAIPSTYKTIVPRPKGFFSSVGEAASKSLSEFEAQNPTKILETLMACYKGLNHILDYDPSQQVLPSGKTILLIDHHVDHVTGLKRELSKDAIKQVLGLQLDAFADAETVVPGESIFVAAKAFTPVKDGVRIGKMRLIAPKGWTIANSEAPKSNTSAFVSRENADSASFFDVTVPRDWQPTQPYWLVEPRNGDLFDWGADSFHKTLPFQVSPLHIGLTVEVNGTEIEFFRPVEFRYADDIRGEIRRNVDVVPGVSVEMGQPLMIVGSSDKPQTKQVVMTVTNHSKQPVRGHVSLNFNMPVHWQYAASSRTFELKRTGEKTAITFDVTVPARMRPGSYQINGQAMIGEGLATSTMRTIAYPHIQTHRYYRRAVVDAKVIDLKTAPVKVGYIIGSGDRVPDAIRQMGFDVEVISESELASGRLSRFDTIVVGIRAFQVRPDVVANNQRLLDYARDGGTLIVQYQLPAYAPLAPFPAQMGPRVVDENAKVTILQPEHPIFNSPNKITADDFTGWVQERNLYNFSTMDAAYTSLLESHDAGEQENKGGLVIAKVGKGNYIYCSYSFFRQLPAGVPGAYRLFANLLSLPKDGKF